MRNLRSEVEAEWAAKFKAKKKVFFRGSRV